MYRQSHKTRPPEDHVGKGQLQRQNFNLEYRCRSRHKDAHLSHFPHFV